MWAEDVVVVEATWTASDYLVQTLSTLRGLVDLGISPESVGPVPRRTPSRTADLTGRPWARRSVVRGGPQCVMHIEDRLQGLYLKSQLLCKMVSTKPDELWTYRAAANLIGSVHTRTRAAYWALRRRLTVCGEGARSGPIGDGGARFVQGVALRPPAPRCGGERLLAQHRTPVRGASGADLRAASGTRGCAILNPCTGPVVVFFVVTRSDVAPCWPA